MKFDVGSDDIFKQFLTNVHQNNNPVVIESHQTDNTVSTNSSDSKESDDESVLHADIRLPELFKNSDQPSKAKMDFVEVKAQAEDIVREVEEFSKSQDENLKSESVRRSSMFKSIFSSIKKITDGAIPLLRKTYPSDSWIDNGADVHVLKEAFKAIKFRGPKNELLDAPTVKLIINVWPEALSWGELKGADNSPPETTILVRESLNVLCDISGFREKAKSFAEHVFTKIVINICKKHSQDNSHELFMKAKYSNLLLLYI